MKQVSFILFRFIFFIIITQLQAQEELQTFQKEYNHTIQSNNDSLQQAFLEQWMKESYRNKNWQIFTISNKRHRILTERLKDSSAYAKNLFYTGRYFEKIKELRLDSAYYYYQRSSRIYKKLQDSTYAGRLLLNIAILEKNIALYKTSETTSFEALSFLPKKDRNITGIYNNLGIVYDNLEDSINAIKYHLRALDIKQKRRASQLSIIVSLNNIGKSYKSFGVYDKAVHYFKQGLSYDSLLLEKLNIKAILLDNYGHALFKKGDTLNGYAFMDEALIIRKDRQYWDGIVISNMHLSEYFITQQDTAKAIKYVEQAKVLSKKTKNFRDYEKVLDILSKLHTGEKVKNYHIQYKKIRDSLETIDRLNKEQFARIKFEVGEKDMILKKQNQNLITRGYIIIAFVILIIILLGIYLKVQYAKGQRIKLFEAGFRNYLITKYGLTNHNIVFWELWVTGLDQSHMAEKLFISIDAVKSRGKSLRSKINQIQKIEGAFTQSKATTIYNLEKDIFREFEMNKK